MKNIFSDFVWNDYTSICKIMSNNDAPSESDPYPDFSHLESVFQNMFPLLTERSHEEEATCFAGNDVVDEFLSELDNEDSVAENAHSLLDDESSSWDECDESALTRLLTPENTDTMQSFSNGESYSAESKKRRRRVRTKPLESKTLLAKSLIEWLEDTKYNPTVIKWISKEEGLFQITDSNAVANLWGNVKGNKSMTHEKLSRALRHYYRDGTLDRIERKKKLYYKFSEAAMVKFKFKLS